MNRKSVWRIAISIPYEAEEAALELFQRLFERPVSSYTDVETKISTIAAYFQERPDVSTSKRAELTAGLKRIRECGLNMGHPRLSMKKLPPQDWAESWKRHF